MRQSKQKGPQWVIGWREWLALPDLGVAAIKVKVDTGARSSTLHAFDVREFRRHGRRMVRFVIHPLQRDSRREVETEAELLEERKVRSSSGDVQLRPVVRTRVQLLDRIWEIDLTLTNRDEMGFRMLLGREALRGNFLIDPSRSYLAGRPPKSKGRRRT